MAIFSFTGQVLPRIVNLDIQPISEAKWDIPEVNSVVTFKTSIKNSVVSVIVDTPVFRDSDMPIYYIRAMDLARAMADTCGFTMGTAFTVFIDKMKYPNGVESSLLFEDKSLRALCTSYALDNIVPALNVINSDPAIFMALNDLMMSITLPHHAAFNLARAVEGIRHIIAGPGTDSQKAWPIMQNALNVDADYLRLMTSISTQPRHGHRVHITGATATEATHRTWIVMDRFMHYRMGGNVQLDLVKFPLLTG